MGKRQIKPRYQKPNKREKVCERCGNGGLTRKREFWCKYCEYWNGKVDQECNVIITRGTLEGDR